MTTSQLESAELQVLDIFESTQVYGGDGWRSCVEIGLGVAAIGLAIAAEIGTVGLASVPAAGVASAGLAAVLHGASTL